MLTYVQIQEGPSWIRHSLAVFVPRALGDAIHCKITYNKVDATWVCKKYYRSVITYEQHAAILLISSTDRHLPNWLWWKHRTWPHDRGPTQDPEAIKRLICCPVDRKQQSSMTNGKTLHGCNCWTTHEEAITNYPVYIWEKCFYIQKLKHIL